MLDNVPEKTVNGVSPTILIISDRPETGPLWVYSLQRKKYNVILESALDKAVERMETEIPEMILIDAQRPDARVLDTVRRLRAETIVPILLMIYAVSEDVIVEAYTAGADDCIIKPIGPALIIAKVRAWMRRDWMMAAETFDNIRINEFVLLVNGRVLLHGSRPPIKLTNLELRLLNLLMTRSPRTLGYEEIIQRVWGYAGEADYFALKNVVYRLRQKIEKDPTQPHFILTTPGKGYKFVGE